MKTPLFPALMLAAMSGFGGWYLTSHPVWLPSLPMTVCSIVIVLCAALVVVAIYHRHEDGKYKDETTYALLVGTVPLTVAIVVSYLMLDLTKVLLLALLIVVVCGLIVWIARFERPAPTASAVDQEGPADSENQPAESAPYEAGGDTGLRKLEAQTESGFFLDSIGRKD